MDNSEENRVKGFITLYRSMLEWEYTDDATVSWCFVKLIMVVNYKPNKWHGRIIEQGSIVCSIDNLCLILHMKRSTLKRCLKVLSDCGAIKVEVEPNKYHIITITNYDVYQKQFIGQKMTDKATDKTTNRTTNKATNKATTTKQRNKVSIPKGIDTAKKKENSVAASGDAPPSQDFYNSIDWHTIQIFGDELKGKTWGFDIPYKVICKFARANNIDDYTAGHFHSIFKLSGTALPNNWEKIFYRYANADNNTRDKFDKEIENGEYKLKWNS